MAWSCALQQLQHGAARLPRCLSQFVQMKVFWKTVLLSSSWEGAESMEALLEVAVPRVLQCHPGGALMPCVQQGLSRWSPTQPPIAAWNRNHYILVISTSKPLNLFRISSHPTPMQFLDEIVIKVTLCINHSFLQLQLTRLPSLRWPKWHVCILDVLSPQPACFPLSDAVSVH